MEVDHDVCLHRYLGSTIYIQALDNTKRRYLLSKPSASNNLADISPAIKSNKFNNSSDFQRRIYPRNADFVNGSTTTDGNPTQLRDGGPSTSALDRASDSLTVPLASAVGIISITRAGKLLVLQACALSPFVSKSSLARVCSTSA